MDEELDFKEYYYIIKKHIFLIVVIFIIILGGAIAYTNYQQPVYEATAVIGLSSGNQIVNPFANTKRGIDVQTYIEMLQSNIITQMVSEKTGIQPDEYDVKLEQPRNTNIIRIKVQAKDPVSATNVANAIAESFIEYNLNMKQQTAENTKSFIDSQLMFLQQELNILNKDLLNFSGKISLSSEEQLKKINIKREIEVKSKLYNDLLLKREEAKIASLQEDPDVFIVDKAVMPIKPVKPNIPLNYSVGIIIGIFSGVTLAIIIESLRGTFNSIEAIESKTGLMVLGTVPKIKVRGRK